MTEYPAVVYVEACKKDESSRNFIVSQTLGNCHEVVMQKNEDGVDSSSENIGQKRKMKDSVDNTDLQQSLKVFLTAFSEDITKKLDSIEHRLSSVTSTCEALEEKVERLQTFVSNSRTPIYVSTASPYTGSSDDSCEPSVPMSSNVTFITLNAEGDYPNGTWLGDKENPERRVRCHITPSELLHINKTCFTAEKMALTLLDYLFDRETQAYSNISGTGKHKKKQLDPLLIYGMQCHLMSQFGITEEDWTKIKQNIDSKCRAAFRRKVKGLPLVPKGGHQGNATPPSGDAENLKNVCVVMNSFTVPVCADSVLTNISTEEEIRETTLALQSVEAASAEIAIEKVIGETSELVHTEHGDIQVLHATPEQLDEIRRNHQIQFLTVGHILATPTDENGKVVLDTNTPFDENSDVQEQ